MNIGGRESSVRKKHHQLTNSFTERQNKDVSSLLSVLENNLSFRVEDCPFLNFTTGNIFTDEVYTSVTSFEETGKKLVEEFIQNRLKPNSSVSIFAHLKKAKLKTCKATNKQRTMQIHDKIVELRENANLFACCALLQSKR